MIEFDFFILLYCENHKICIILQIYLDSQTLKKY